MGGLSSAMASITKTSKNIFGDALGTGLAGDPGDLFGGQATLKQEELDEERQDIINEIDNPDKDTQVTTKVVGSGLQI